MNFEIGQPDRCAGSLLPRGCNACGGQCFTLMGRRSDGTDVLRCEACGLGVVETIPPDLNAYYDDAYYGSSKADDAVGYEDYQFTAEHGLSWAAEIVQLLKASGRVLDVGCADGTLLRKLPDRFERYGIEVNERMAASAAETGTWILGRDLLDPSILREHQGRFDVVTSIAVFEHLPDLRRGIKVALDLLKPDGVLLFEMPYISEEHDNRVWFESSLEHVFYPSGTALRCLIEDLDAYSVGGELYIRGFASNYVGFAFRDRGLASHLQRLFKTLTSTSGNLPTMDEHRARQQLMLVHAAESTPDLITGLAELPAGALNQPLLRRFEQLWGNDVRRLAALRQERDAIADARDWQTDQTNRQAALVREWEERYTALQTEAATALRGEAAARCQAALVREWEERYTALQTEAATALRGEAAAREKAEQELSRQAALLERVQEASEAAAQAHNQATEHFAIAKSDYQLNLVKLLRALEDGDAQKRSHENAVAVLKRELAFASADGETLRRQLNNVLSSTSWKATYPLRQIGARHGRLARLVRQALTVVWWLARLELSSRLREVRQQRHAAVLGVSKTARADFPMLAISERNGCTHPLPDDDETDPWPTGRPLVSIVITAFNYGHFVAEAVDSVLAQTFTDLEIIVVEGGSTSAKSRRLTLGFERPRTRVIAQDGPHLVGANRNLGICQARGKYICCLDADDLLAPTYIEKAVFLLEAYGYDVISTATQYFGNRHERVGILESPTLAEMLEGNHMLTCAVFRRSLWRRAGGYRDAEPDITGYVYEDWMFWTRLAALGARMHNICREHMFLYRSHGPSLSTQLDLHPEPVHRALIHQANADLIGAEAIVRSQLTAAELRIPTEPLHNLVGRAAKPRAGQPVLLLALPFTIVGGAERLLSRVADHLADQGWRVLITTSIDPGLEHGDTTHWFEPATAEIFHLPRFLDPERWPEFVRYLIASRAVNVLWIAGSTFMYELLPALRAEFPQLRVTDILFNPVGHTANNRKYAELIDLTFVENQEVLRFLRDAGEADSRIAFNSSGVDLDAYQPGPRDSAVIEALGAAPDELIVGFSGRWSEEKDPLAFVEIARRMPPHLPARFVMTGMGSMRGAIEDALHVAAMPKGRFHLVGEVVDVVPWIRSYDVLVLPSRLDGRPVAVLEALALGVPILASRVGALPELVEEGINGFLCPPREVDTFLGCLLRLVHDRQLLARMKKAARRYAERHLDARAMMARYEDRLRTLAESSGL